MKRLLFVVLPFALLLLATSTGSADKIRFRCDEMVLNPGDADSVVVTSYDSSFVAMVTICSGKADSSIGFRSVSHASGKHHYVGFPQAVLSPWLGVGDTTRTLIRFDVSAIPDSAYITSAILYLRKQSGAITTPNGLFLAVDPIAPAFAWEANHTIGGRGQCPFQAAGISPTWFEVENGAGTWTKAGADSAQLITDRAGNDRFVGGSGIWLNVHHTAATAWLPVDVTGHFTGGLADSFDLSAAGWVISLDIAGGVSDDDYIQLIDHLGDIPLERPYLEVEYVDTTRVETPPKHLRSDAGGMSTTSYQVGHVRPTFGRLVFLSDTHSDGAGGVGGDWRDFRKTLDVAMSQTPTPDAVVHCGDIGFSTTSNAGTEDSLAAMIAIVTDAGAQYEQVAGNWDGEPTWNKPFSFLARVFPQFSDDNAYYEKDFGFCRLLCLNTNTGFNDGIQPLDDGCVDDSLGTKYSRQWSIIEKTFANRRKGQPVIAATHKAFSSPQYTAHRKQLRDHNAEQYKAAADSTCWRLETGTAGRGVDLVVQGHIHGAGCSVPLVHWPGADTIFARAADDADGRRYVLAADDSAAVYYNVAMLTTGAYLSANEVTYGRARRWWSGNDPAFLMVDVVGDWLSCALIDTNGTQLDTLLVVRGE